MPILVPIPLDERRLMQKAIHKTRDKYHARRVTAILILHLGASPERFAVPVHQLDAGLLIGFTLSGVEGFQSLLAGRSFRWPFEHICILVRELIKHSSADFSSQLFR